MREITKTLSIPLEGNPRDFRLKKLDAFSDGSPGDACLVIFADIDIDAWLSSGNPEEPPSARKHSLSDGFAFVGFRTGGSG